MYELIDYYLLVSWHAHGIGVTKSIAISICKRCHSFFLKDKAANSIYK